MFRRNFEADEDKIMADDRSKSTNNKSIVIEIEFVEFDCSWSYETTWCFVVVKENKITFRTTQ